jgi:hypothetical protein
MILGSVVTVVTKLQDREIGFASQQRKEIDLLREVQTGSYSASF